MEGVDDGRHAGVLLNGECEGRKVVWEERVGGLSERASSERGRRPPANELSRSRLGHELDDGRMATDRSTARAIREPPISRAAWPVEPKPCNLPAMACRSIWLVGRSWPQEQLLRRAAAAATAVTRPQTPRMMHLEAFSRCFGWDQVPF
jgi:hypothetical protein